MTQRIFDMDNEQDVRDLWSIMPDDVVRIKPAIGISNRIEFENDAFNTILFAINWHDKTEITRPVYEITDQDIGKICCFWEEKQKIYGKLHHIEKGILGAKIYFINNYDSYPNCRRLTKQEIEELC